MAGTNGAATRNTTSSGDLPGKERILENFAHFVEYTGAVTSLFPSSLTVSFAWAATVAETVFGILLIAGFKIRMASVLSGLLLFVICYGHGHRSWHQDAIRLFGLLGGRCSILTGVLGA